MEVLNALYIADPRRKDFWRIWYSSFLCSSRCVVELQRDLKKKIHEWMCPKDPSIWGGRMKGRSGPSGEACVDRYGSGVCHSLATLLYWRCLLYWENTYPILDVWRSEEAFCGGFLMLSIDNFNFFCASTRSGGCVEVDTVDMKVC